MKNELILKLELYTCDFILFQRFFSHSSTCGKLARTFCTSSHLLKNLRAGKIHNPKNFRLSYEVTWPPDAIGVKKAWNSWNTSKYGNCIMCVLNILCLYNEFICNVRYTFYIQ